MEFEFRPVINERSCELTKILVLHGKGMEMRGKTDTDIFGTMTLPEYDEKITKYASDLNVEVDIFHSNDVSEVISKVNEMCSVEAIKGILINPAGFTVGNPTLEKALKTAGVDVVEIHMSNPARRGRISDIAPVCRGVIAGMGIEGYKYGLKALKEFMSN